MAELRTATSSVMLALLAVLLAAQNMNPGPRSIVFYMFAIYYKLYFMILKVREVYKKCTLKKAKKIFYSAVTVLITCVQCKLARDLCGWFHHDSVIIKQGSGERVHFHVQCVSFPRTCSTECV